MNALTILAALLVVGCGALEEQAPAFDTAATDAMQTGACLKLVCAIPLSDCRVRPARCHR